MSEPAWKRWLIDLPAAVVADHERVKSPYAVALAHRLATQADNATGVIPRLVTMSDLAAELRCNRKSVSASLAELEMAGHLVYRVTRGGTAIRLMDATSPEQVNPSALPEFTTAPVRKFARSLPTGCPREGHPRDVPETDIPNVTLLPSTPEAEPLSADRDCPSVALPRSGDGQARALISTDRKNVAGVGSYATVDRSAVNLGLSEKDSTRAETGDAPHVQGLWRRSSTKTTEARYSSKQQTQVARLLVALSKGPVHAHEWMTSPPDGEPPIIYVKAIVLKHIGERLGIKIRVAERVDGSPVFEAVA